MAEYYRRKKVCQMCAGKSVDYKDVPILLKYINEKGKVSVKEFYTVYEPDLTEAELEEYLKYKELSILNTIKNLTYTKINLLNMITDCLIFIVLLMVVALILGGIAFNT